MRSYSPQIVLALLVAAAVVIFVGGSRLSQRQEKVRVERDREPFRLFALSLQGELNRLERLYESHLCRIARNMPVEDCVKIIPACNWLSGLKQVSVLPVRSESPVAPLHVMIDPVAGEGVPRPAFLGMERDEGLGIPVVVLPDAVRQAEVHDSGWIDQPGSPPLFWYRRSEEACIVMVVKREVVVDCMNQWMREWVKRHYVPMDTDTGGESIMGPGNSLLAGFVAGSRELERAPDFVLPLNQRFASWQLLSWDGWRMRAYSHVPTVAGSAALAVLVALIGAGIFAQQRRELKLAEHRVSFINRVSHELRAPLTNMLLNIDLAADTLENRGGEGARRLDRVREEGRRLSRLIDNVLTFSRHEQGRLELHPRTCIPVDIIDAVVAQFAAALERRSIRVEVEGGSRQPCVLDPDAFAQILTNLVSNVEKFAAGGGYLGVRARLEEGRLLVTVRDRGRGIPADDEDRIFRAFHRLHDETREGATGTGLGLAIARELAERMGGILRLLPSDAGAVFELAIPCTSVPEREESAV